MKASGVLTGFMLLCSFSQTVVGQEMEPRIYSASAKDVQQNQQNQNDAAGTSDFLLYDTILHGPLLGFVFRF